LAAIIITAVWPLINPPSVFYKFWKTSLADFISAMLAFWVCLFVSTEAGLGAAVGFNIVYVLLRQTFTSVKSISSGDHKELSELQQSLDSSRGMPANIPDDLRIFRFHESFFFPNAYGVKTTILNNIKTHHSPAYSSRNGAEAERIWSVQGERQVARLRKKMKITDPDSLPPANVIVFDLTKCNHLDSTACTQLKQLVAELRLYCGKQVELRFTGASDYVRTRMWRAGFELVDDVDATREDQEKGVPQHFASLTQAISAPRRDGDQLWKETLETMNEKKGDTVERIEHIEEKV
jgi:sodium-independent sulfate anion transporter 11